MPHIVTFDGLIAGPDKLESQLDGSLIAQAELMEPAPKDSEYRPNNLVDVITGKSDSNWVFEKAELMEHAPKDSEYRINNYGLDQTLRPDFMTEIFEPTAGMYSFGESLNLALEVGGTSGLSELSYMTGNIGLPCNNIAGSASLGGDTI